MTEFELIDLLSKKTPLDKSVLKGIGDDTAVIKWNKRKYMLITTDMLIEGVHFVREKVSAFQIGWKAMAVNISDIAAMGGVPKWAVVSVGLPRRRSGEKLKKFAEEIYEGIKKSASRFKINIVGGDTNHARLCVVNITLIGEVMKRDLVLRSGAKIGDRIFVTGSLGGSINGRHLDFIPRIKEAQSLVKNFKINAMIDISDGLSSDIRRICQQSGCGAVIYSEALPVSKGSNLKGALCDGEDFELLFTVSRQEAVKLLRTCPKPYDENRAYLRRGEARSEDAGAVNALRQGRTTQPQPGADKRIPSEGFGTGSIKSRHIGRVPIREIGEIVEKDKGIFLLDGCGRGRELKERGFRHF